MKTFLILSVVLGVSVCHPGPIAPTLRFHAKRQVRVDLGNSTQEFALDMSEVLWNEPGNVVFSPLSIVSLMSLLMGGSAGDTYFQLRSALRFDAHTTDQNVHGAYQALMQELEQQSNDEVIVSLATRLFLASGFNVLSNYTQLAQQSYGADVSTIPFSRNPTRAMKLVNEWVNRETRGKISQLVTQPFRRSTKFVAANTVYFNGAWMHPFDTVREATFHTGDASIGNITVDMMSATMTVPHVFIRELNADMIALPYKGYAYGMFLVKPNGPLEDKELQTVERVLDATTLNRYISQMSNSTMKVNVPRMRLEFKAYMKDALRDLGVRSMFSQGSADFSKVTASEHIWVDDMIHQTVIEITLTGTEAASATSVSLNRIGTSNSFEVNRPCLFFIRHMRSGLPLFWGRIMKPDPISNSSR